MATAAGFDVAGPYPIVVRKLQDGFRALADDDGLRPVLIFDEAQDLRPDVLAQLRILTNFDMDSRLVLSLILAGDGQLRLLQELLRDFPQLDLLEEIKTFRWYFDDDLSPKKRTHRASLRRWIARYKDWRR